MSILYAQSEDERVQEHSALRELLDKEYFAEKYSFDLPYIKVNPFGNSPLLAEVRFASTEELKISIFVRAKNGSYTGVKYDKWEKQHRYPILGLYPNESNFVLLLAKDKKNKTKRIRLRIDTDELPQAYPKLGTELKVIKRDQQKLRAGFYMLLLVKRNIPIGSDFFYSAIDTNGDVRWLNTELKGHIFERSGKGTAFVTLATPKNIYHSEVLYEMDDFGQYLRSWSVPSLIHHEIFVLPNDRLLILSSSEDYLEDTVIEYDLKTSKVIEEWNIADYIPSDRTPLPSYVHLKDKDWSHLNAMDYDATSDTILVSSRNQSAIVAFGRKSRLLKWISGPHTNWGEAQKPYLLTLEGPGTPPSAITDPTLWHWGQHAINIGKGGKLFVFDNGRGRSFDPAKGLNSTELYSRAIEYALDLRKRSIQQVWEFGREYGSELYASYVSSLQDLPEDKTIFISFGGITKDDTGQAVHQANAHNSVRLFEVTKDSEKKILFEVSIRAEKIDAPYGFRVYRAVKYDSLSF